MLLTAHDSMTHLALTRYLVKRVKKESAAVTIDEFCKQGSYCGDWVADRRQGYGVCIYGNGDKYEGSWRADRRHGRGTLWRKSAVGRGLVKVFEGEFADGSYDGMGRLYCDDGGVYEGSFAAGKRSGQGMQRFGDGSVYNGDWLEDKAHGRGRLVLDNGDTFDGHFLNGHKHGPG